jgi:hypothetical protein
MVIDEEVYKLKQLEKLAEDEPSNSGWMGSHPSHAFLIALGAGPWRKERRAVVQGEALEWFRSRYHDLCTVPTNLKVFPLAWQNKFLNNMVASLKELSIPFTAKCRSWRTTNDWKKAVIEFFSMCGVGENGSKVLWLFVRDFLELPAFPIDRHVERSLQKVGLISDAWHIIKLCELMRIDPNNLNRRLFVAEAENPDWSDYAIAMRREDAK